MTPHERIVDTARQVQRATFVVAVVYAAIGLGVTAYAAAGHQVVIGFVGLMIFSFAVSCAVLLNMVMRIGERVSLMAERLDGIHSSISRLEHTQHALFDHALRSEASSASVGVAEGVVEPIEVQPTVDLTAVGAGDPGLLAGAVLDRARFPRLASVLEEPSDRAVAERAMLLDEAPACAEAAAPAASEACVAAEARVEAEPVAAAEHHVGNGRNMLQTWSAAVQVGDLGTAREVFSTLVDTADDELVSSLRRELLSLEHDVERRLRAEFARCVRTGDFGGALDAGREMTALLPESAITVEFARLEPHLRRKLSGATHVEMLAPT